MALMHHTTAACKPCFYAPASLDCSLWLCLQRCCVQQEGFGSPWHACCACQAPLHGGMAMQEVVNFVGSLDQVKGDFSLASSAHRKVLTDDALDRSLSDLQLTPQALLFVQNAEEPEA